MVPKVAINLNSGSDHAIRGIGVHTAQLTAMLHLYKTDIDLFEVDFSKQNLSQFDLVHYPNFHPFFLTLPAHKPAKKMVVTIHDLIPLIYPDHYPPGIRGRISFLKQKRRLKKADAIITISETSKKDICRFLEVDPRKVFVVYLASKDSFFKKQSKSTTRIIERKYDLPKKFVLYVGDVNYNKNVPGLITACEQGHIPLVVVGKSAANLGKLANDPNPELRHLKGIMSKLKNVRRLGFVSDDELVSLYNLATVYCQPSFYEGFGLPLLEAMACGCPVVASRIQAHVEIAEAGCLFFDPKDPSDIAAKIKEVLKSSELKNQLIESGLALSKKYSWDKTAKETLFIYKKVLTQNI